MKGVKRAFVKTSGKEKVRLSVLYTASAAGHKLPILCVVPRARQIPGIDLGEDFIYIYETKGWLRKNFLN